MKLTLDIKEAHVVSKQTIIDHDVVGTFLVPAGSVVVTLSDGFTRFAFHKDHFLELFPGFDFDHDPESERLDGIPTDATPLMHEDDAELDRDVEIDVTDIKDDHDTGMDRAANDGFPTTDDTDRVEPFLVDEDEHPTDTHDDSPVIDETVDTDKTTDK